MPALIRQREPRKWKQSLTLIHISNLPSCGMFYSSWMTLICLTFLIFLLSLFNTLTLASLASLLYPSLLLPVLRSLSLSGCPLADKSLRSLMAAHTPELKYVCSSPLLPFHCHLDALLPTPSYTGMPCFNASFAAASAADTSLLFVLFVVPFPPDQPQTHSVELK